MRRGVVLLAMLATVGAAAAIGGLAATACAAGSAPAPSVTPRLTQVLPTPFSTRTPVIVPTPQEVTPVPAAEAGRSDCPWGWNAYSDADGHFSLCYPSGVVAITGGATRPELRGDSLNMWTPDPGAHFPPTVRTDISENGFFMAMGWDVDPAYARIKTGWERKLRGWPDLPFTADLCSHVPLLIHQEASAPAEVQVAGRTGLGCTATGFDDPSYPHMKVIDVVIPVRFDGDPQGGYVNLMVRYLGPDLAAADAAGSAVLDTLVIPER